MASRGGPREYSWLSPNFYAEELNYALQRMEGHFIRGDGDGSREAFVRVLPETVTETSNFLADDNVTMHRINPCKRPDRRIRESPRHGVADHGFTGFCARTPTTDAELALKLVHTWNARKQKIFPGTHTSRLMGN